jgi:hypothetical protein
MLARDFWTAIFSTGTKDMTASSIATTLPEMDNRTERLCEMEIFFSENERGYATVKICKTHI